MQSKYLNMFFNALMFIGQYKFLENMRLNVCVCFEWLASGQLHLGGKVERGREIEQRTM